jgi:hypothetical protein
VTALPHAPPASPRLEALRNAGALPPHETIPVAEQDCARDAGAVRPDTDRRAPVDVPTWCDVVDATAINSRSIPASRWHRIAPTTRLCLAWLARSCRAASRFSFWMRLGNSALPRDVSVRPRCRTDIDPQALQGTAPPSPMQWTRSSAPDELAIERTPFDVVVANIPANP